MQDSQTQLTTRTSSLQEEAESLKSRLTTIAQDLEESRRTHRHEIEDLQREHIRRIEDAKYSAETQTRQILREQNEKFDEGRRKLEAELKEENQTLGNGLQEAKTLYEKQIEELKFLHNSELLGEKEAHEKALSTVRSEGSSYQDQASRELDDQKRLMRAVEGDLVNSKSETAKERESNIELRARLSETANSISNLQTSIHRLESHIKFLESDNKSQSQAFADLEARTQNAVRIAAEANEKLIKEETLRRKLHNQVQELKGNIRVFCRARPPLESDSKDLRAKIEFPDAEADCKEIEVMGPEEKSSLGNITTRKNSFDFDRIFGPNAQNEEIFGEISQLVQSALDGYNVCIFCYGQTGSGKTFTMSAADGMIPRAVRQIYGTATSLEEKGWKYQMEGCFVEVYNENLNDLLGKAEDFDKKKHEIKHDLQKGKTTITGVSTVDLDSPDRVKSILARATSNRSVAATQANERSSRSHSVFILKLKGENSNTGEISEGTLNLVDLAGSERLSHSGATGDRLKETQNINKSLSCLGDVIGALGQGKEGAHVPYRNSKVSFASKLAFQRARQLSSLSVIDD